MAPSFGGFTHQLLPFRLSVSDLCSFIQQVVSWVSILSQALLGVMPRTPELSEHTSACLLNVHSLVTSWQLTKSLRYQSSLASNHPVCLYQTQPHHAKANATYSPSHLAGSLVQPCLLNVLCSVFFISPVICKHTFQTYSRHHAGCVGLRMGY